jgi:hypothetical protein
MINWSHPHLNNVIRTAGGQRVAIRVRPTKEGDAVLGRIGLSVMGANDTQWNYDGSHPTGDPSLQLVCPDTDLEAISKAVHPPRWGFPTAPKRPKPAPVKPAVAHKEPVGKKWGGGKIYE